MNRAEKIGWIYLSIILNSAILPILCYPSAENSPHIVLAESRKFAEKQNPPKKASLAAVENRNDLSDVQTNQIPDSSGFSWSNVLTSLVQMLFSSAGATGPSKSDSPDNDQQVISQSPWANLLTLSLKVLTAFLSGGQIAGSDNIDKVDNGSPYQGLLTAVLSALLGTKNEDQVAKVAQQAGEFINIIVQLLDTLRQSFGHRSMTARSLGKKDSISEATVAGLTFVKGYVRTMKSPQPECVQKIVCEANKECTDSLSQPNPIYCQFGTYAANTILQKTTSVPYEKLQEAGRVGRSAKNAYECSKTYSSCQEN